MGDHEHHSDHEHAHTSQLGYLGVLGALFLGTVVTWKARDLGHAQHWSLGFSAFIALAIATIKASLVVYFFMHVRESAKIIKLTAEFNRIIMLPDVQAKSLELGFEPVAWGPDKLNAFLADQMGKIKRLVDAGRVKA